MIFYVILLSKKDRLRISGPTECHSDVIGGGYRFALKVSVTMIMYRY